MVGWLVGWLVDFVPLVVCLICDFVCRKTAALNEVMCIKIMRCVNVVGSVALAEENRDFVIGFVCQSRVTNNQSFVHFTPGMSV